MARNSAPLRRGELPACSLKPKSLLLAGARQMGPMQLTADRSQAPLRLTPERVGGKQAAVRGPIDQSCSRAITSTPMCSSSSGRSIITQFSVRRPSSQRQWSITRMLIGLPVAGTPR